MEQPASRQSKPAAVKIRSSPSASAWAFTWRDPGTTIARTVEATVRPSTTLAAARRSSMRPLVHDPRNTASMGMSSMASPPWSPM